MHLKGRINSRRTISSSSHYRIGRQKPVWYTSYSIREVVKHCRMARIMMKNLINQANGASWFHPKTFTPPVWSKHQDWRQSILKTTCNRHLLAQIIDTRATNEESLMLAILCSLRHTIITNNNSNHTLKKTLILTSSKTHQLLKVNNSTITRVRKSNHNSRCNRSH